MLVLSRRENQKVLFPGLGISVEVIRAGSNKVQLGIDAPREIRVIRDELPCRDQQFVADNGDKAFQANQSSEVYQAVNEAIHQDLKSAALAVHLAKNQIKQGLEENAESALNDALATLEKIESRLRSNSETDYFEPECSAGELSYSVTTTRDTSTEFVGETRYGYEVSRRPNSRNESRGKLNTALVRRLTAQCFEKLFESI